MNDMSANYAPETCSDNVIRSYVDSLANSYGRAFIPANASWSAGMIEIGISLALACGVPPERAKTLRPHELAAFYSVARKAPDSARRLALKYAPAIPATPAPAPLPPVQGMTDEAAQAAIADALAKLAVQVLDDSRNSTDKAIEAFQNSLPRAVQDMVERLAPRATQITIADAPPVTIPTAHKELPLVLTCCANGIWPYLVGPAGSGKTTLAEQVAQAMGRKFYMAAKVQSEFTLLGFINAAGLYVRTPFRDCYEYGGIFLLDEMDASSASALAAFNAALANGHCPFPDGLIARHPDFVCIGAGNTIGTGANRQYVGRAQLDAATLDRFAFVTIEYDKDIEAAMCPNGPWLSYIQAIRNYVDANAIRAIVSPRASKAGATLLAAGVSWQVAAKALVFDKLSSADAERIRDACPDYLYDVNPIL